MSADAPLRLERSQGEDGTLVIALRGELDLHTVGAADRGIRAAMLERDPVVLDLSELEFIDSSGLRCFLRLRKLAAKADRSLQLVGARHEVARVFEIAGLRSLLQ